MVMIIIALLLIAAMMMIFSFNLESPVHADEQSSYQLGIAAFRQAYYFFLSGDVVQ